MKAVLIFQQMTEVAVSLYSEAVSEAHRRHLKGNPYELKSPEL